MNHNFFIVNPEMPLQEFFQKVLAKGQNVAVVMEGNSLLGLIDRENVEEQIQIQEALGQRR